MKVKSESEDTQSCLTLSDPMDHSLPGSSVHGIVQARVLERVAIAFSTLLSELLWLLISSIFIIFKNIHLSQPYIILLNKASKNQHWKKYCAFTAALFSTELHVDTYKLFKCLKNILKTFIHLKTHYAFICKVSLFHLSLIRLKKWHNTKSSERRGIF